jgi:tetratricopeptide (TPR) repeat protein
VIDLDRMDEQLARAVAGGADRRPQPWPPTVAPVPPSAARPAPGALPPLPARRRPRRAAGPGAAPAAAEPAAADPARGVPELLELGLLDEADARIATATGRCDALTWATMRALLDGRRDATRAGLDELLGLARATDDAEAQDRYWAQRFWGAFLWGADAERYDVLDHCRGRAYRFDDLEWWGRLTLLLAALGKADEAVRAFDAASALLGRVAKSRMWLDVTTNLVEGAALLGDTGRVAAAHRTLAWPAGRVVVVGPAVVCKGSVDHYRGLGLAALGRGADAADCFRAAAEAHRSMGAAPLLARTVQQSAGALAAA